jgi:nicotinate phosphoribosyltransferase
MVIKLQNHRKGEIRKSYGIGTNLTNDIIGVNPMNIVIKLMEINGMPTIKLSDSTSKHIGNEETIRFVEWQNNQALNK